MPADSAATDSLVFNRRWAKRFFSSASDSASLESPVALHDGGLPFSFVYGGRQVSRIAGNWKATVWCENAGGDKELRILTLTDPATGLEVRAEAIIYNDTGGIDWTLHFTNRGTKETPILEQVQAVDVTVLPKGDGRPNPSSAPRQQRRRRGLAADGRQAGPGSAGRIRPVRRAGQFVIGRLPVLQPPMGWRRRDHGHRLDGAVAGDGRARRGRPPPASGRNAADAPEASPWRVDPKPADSPAPLVRQGPDRGLQPVPPADVRPHSAEARGAPDHSTDRPYERRVQGGR